MNSEREEKRRAEMAAGRRRTMINMAEGMVHALAEELGYRYEQGYRLNSNALDNREWTVSVELPADQVHTESWWVFPSDELKATIMLMRGH